VVEPLGENGDGGHVGEAYAETDENALGEVEMPDSVGK
jgi:hypothetical protein